MNPYTEESFQKFINQLIPEAPLTSFNDRGGGGGDRGSYFIPQKITTSEFVYQKKSLLFYHTQKNPLVPFLQPKKIPLFVFATQKNPGVFHRPKRNHFWPKFQTQKNHSDLPSLKYVSGALSN